MKLKPIEIKLLRYIKESGEKVKTTVSFAKKEGYDISTINNVAKSLEKEYLVKTTIAAGGHPDKPHLPITLYYLELTPDGVDLLALTPNQNPINQDEPINNKIEIIETKSSPSPTKGIQKWQLVVAVIIALCAVISLIIKLKN